MKKAKRTERKGKDHSETSTTNPDIPGGTGGPDQGPGVDDVPIDEIDDQGRKWIIIGGDPKREGDPENLGELAKRIRACNTFIFQELPSWDYDDEDFRCAEKEYAKFYCMAATLGGENIPPLKTDNPVYDLKRLEQWCKGDLEAGNGEKKLQAKTKKRATRDEMKTRNTVVLYEASKIKADYDRLPTVEEIAKISKYTPRQIRETVAYREGKISRNQAILTTEAARSATNSEYASDKTGVGQQNIKRSKSQQAELDDLIDEQKRYDRNNHA